MKAARTPPNFSEPALIPLAFIIPPSYHFGDSKMEVVMAKAQRMTAFTVSLEDRPGSLFELMKMLKEMKVNLVGTWGYSMGPGQAEVIFVGKKPEKLRDALNAAGRAFTERSGFFAKGADKVGALLENLQAISNAGINLDAANAISVGGQYGVFYWVREEDAGRTEEVLGKKK